MLTIQAASDYYELSLIEADFGIIGLSEYYTRIAFLIRNSELEPNFLYYEDFLHETINFVDEEEDTSGEWTVESSIIQDELHGSGRRGYRASIPPQPIMLKFMSPSVPHARTWIFHQADVDPHPSVPHGHDNDSSKKLDAYTGGVFSKRKEVSREPRALIVALWNDKKFRDFAWKAVTWYMVTYPRYRWRVPNPLKFPKH